MKPRKRIGRGRGRGRGRTDVSDEIRATLGDHVLIHALSMKVAGQRVQTNLSCYTHTSVICTLTQFPTITTLLKISTFFFCLRNNKNCRILFFFFLHTIVHWKLISKQYKDWWEMNFNVHCDFIIGNITKFKIFYFYKI